MFTTTTSYKTKKLGGIKLGLQVKDPYQIKVVLCLPCVKALDSGHGVLQILNVHIV